MSSLPVVLCCAVLGQFAASVGASEIETFSYRSLSVVHAPQGELTALAQAHFAAPDRYREDSSMSFGKIVTVRRGDASWAATPRGVSALTPDQHRRTVARIYRNYLGLAWAVAAGRVEAEEAGDGSLRLRVEGTEMRARFDESTGRLVELTAPGSNLAGQHVTERRRFAEFDDATGLPARVEVYHDEALAAEITIRRWQKNESLAPELFDAPEGAPTPEPNQEQERD